MACYGTSSMPLHLCSLLAGAPFYLCPGPSLLPGRAERLTGQQSVFSELAMSHAWSWLTTHAVCMYATMDRYTAIKYNILFKTCLILFGSPLTLLALSRGWCLLTFWRSTAGSRNKNSFFSRLCADTEAVGCTLGGMPRRLQTHL